MNKTDKRATDAIERVKMAFDKNDECNEFYMTSDVVLFKDGNDAKNHADSIESAKAIRVTRKGYISEIKNAFAKDSVPKENNLPIIDRNKALEKVKFIFAKNPALMNVCMTVDLNVFINQRDASNHARTLKDCTVYEITRKNFNKDVKEFLQSL